MGEAVNIYHIHTHDHGVMTVEADEFVQDNVTSTYRFEAHGGVVAVFNRSSVVCVLKVDNTVKEMTE